MRRRCGTLTDRSNAKRTLLIFLISLVLTTAVLYAGKGIRKHVLHQRMVAWSAASARDTDGAENRVVLNGKPGYLGESSVYLDFTKDGYISLSGDNPEEIDGWKLISEFTIEPGNYTLTGLKGAIENTVALQLYISDDTGYDRYLCQWNEDINFTVERDTEATLHARVFPFVDEVDIVARPAVYRDE